MSLSGSVGPFVRTILSRAARPGPRSLFAPGLLAVLLLVACDGDGPDTPDVIRARAEALAVDLKLKEAAAVLAPLVAAPDASEHDLVRAGIIALAQSLSMDAATAWADRAVALAPKDPAAQFLRGNLHLNEQEYPEAEACFRAVLAIDPGDLPARMQLAEALDQSDKSDEAEAIWRQVQAAGYDADHVLYRLAIYKLKGVLLYAGKTEEGLALAAEHKRLDPQPLHKGEPPPKEPDASALGYGRLMPPTPAARKVAPRAPEWPEFRAGPVVDLHGAEHLLARDLDRDGRIDLLGWGPAGLVVALQKSAGAFRVQVVHERPVLSLDAGDLGTGDDGDPQVPDDPRRQQYAPALELLCVEAEDVSADRGTWALYASNDTGTYQSAGPEGLQAGDAHAGILSDIDHDGDLDLVLATGSGLRIARNDGFTGIAMPVFGSVTCDAGRALGDCRAVIAEDFDGDNDVDFLVVTAHGLALLSNDRREQFSDVSAAWTLPSLAPESQAAAVTPGAPRLVDALDLDEDGRADIVLTGGDGTLMWARNARPDTSPPGGVAFAEQEWLRPERDLAQRVFADLDLDGHVDLLARRADAVVAGLGYAPAGTLEPVMRLSPLEGALAPGVGGDGKPRPFAVADLDGDARPDLVLLGAGSAHVLLNDGPTGHALPLFLDGQRDNDEGIGSIVELRTGDLYRRLYWRGPELLGLGKRDVAQVVRMSWPNGVIQHELDKPAGVPLHVEEVNRLVGSCPFLYTWNGTRFEFITDVLGTTPLGLPLDDTQFVPFDHDEYVKVRGDQLVPRDGRLSLAITEELREVTYLDAARLHAIDHPAAVEIQPNERFSFPPFPPHHVHTFSQVVAPARVLASNGTDVTAQVSAVDDDCARPFRRLPSMVDGLADSWWLDITLAETPEQRAALAAAPRIRLAFTGWLQWGNASVNLSAARDPDIAFEPPLLWVPDGDGWKPAGDPIGFPAGKTKTMVIDVTDLVQRDDPRLRVSTTLQLSWDAIRIVLDADDAPFTDTALAPFAALLHYRGFSWPQDTSDGTRPEVFDWDDHALPRWNQHPGMYTRYGSVLPLLDAADDMYAILGSGDCVRLEFDAAALPPLPAGWTRDWLLFLDGWAKDRDPATAAAERVEPLPFHAMSAYPPPAGEHFPDDAAHRAWQADWNTREGAVLVPPIDAASQPLAVRIDASLKPVR